MKVNLMDLGYVGGGALAGAAISSFLSDSMDRSTSRKVKNKAGNEKVAWDEVSGKFREEDGLDAAGKPIAGFGKPLLGPFSRYSTYIDLVGGAAIVYLSASYLKGNFREAGIAAGSTMFGIRAMKLVEEFTRKNKETNPRVVVGNLDYRQNMGVMRMSPASDEALVQVLH